MESLALTRDEPIVRAWFLREIAYHRREQGEHEAAQALWDAIIEVCVRWLGDAHPLAEKYRQERARDQQ